MGDKQWFVLYVLVCLEVGFFLMLVPWSAIWERNYFLETFPNLRPFLLSPAFRGAVCGLGLANIYVGVSEILDRLRRSGDGARARDGDEREGGSERGEGSRSLAASEER